MNPLSRLPVYPFDSDGAICLGLELRQHIAIGAMVALMMKWGKTPEETAKDAVAHADALIEELSK